MRYTFKHTIMITIIDKLAQLEGIEHLPEIDPNTQNSAVKSSDSINKLAQAIIPAVLAGFYKFSRNEQNAAMIPAKNALTDWIEILFGNREEESSKENCSICECVCPNCST